MLDIECDWLRTLAADIGAIRREAGDDAATVTAVATRLSVCGKELGRLPDRFRATSGEAYTQHLLYVAPDRGFSIVALAWRPGQRTPIHDHRGWCAVSVYEGAEQETRYRLCRDASGSYLTAVGTQVLEPGAAVALLPDGNDVHRVSNCSSDLTVSLHVYGLDIARTGSSIGSRYDAMPVRVGAIP